jgi:hypothetical protein
MRLLMGISKNRHGTYRLGGQLGGLLLPRLNAPRVLPKLAHGDFISFNLQLTMRCHA